LLPAADRVTVESLRITPARIEVELRCTAGAASCPICVTASRHVHSRYVRIVRDLPWGGMPMTLRLWTRRFYCDNADCRRRIFAEQLPELARRRARGTPRLEQTLVQVGLECGGEPGRRLCGQLGIDTSGDTILRRLRAAPPASGHAGSVIGVDDFAFRRGKRYGTIVVDHESGAVIDLLPDRTSATLEAWLAARPDLPAVVTRDRSGVYAKAITTAAPDAVQVADRWHLLANCREALVRVLDRHHSPIVEAMVATPPQMAKPETVQNVAQSAVNPLPPSDLQAVVPPAPSPVRFSKNQQQSIDRRAKRLARYEQMVELKRQGQSQRMIGLELKMSRRQVQKLFNADGFPERAKTYRTKQVDHYMEQLRARWEDGVRNANDLAGYIRTLGYTGGNDMVKRCVASWRTAAERLRLRGTKSKPRSPIPLKLERPSSNRLSWLLTKDDLERRTGESELLDRLQKHCEPIRMAGEVARSFGEAVRGRDINALTAWRDRALQMTATKEMNGFAEGLVRNWPEVKAAVELPWSNGRAEGHVNRLKLIKRKMYGRAKLDLLRIRVLGSGP
jgi:transposase